MNLEQGAATSNKEPEKAWLSLHVTENKKDEERRSNFSERCQRESSNERLIEYCEEEDEECNEAVSGKLAIHLDTGETSREFCINRVDDAHSRRSQTREESVTCGSELEQILFIKKSSVALQSPTQIELLYFCFCPPGKSLCRRNLQLVLLCIFIFILILILKTLPEAQQTQGPPP